MAASLEGLVAEVREHLALTSEEVRRATGPFGALVDAQLRAGALLRGEAWSILEGSDASHAARRAAADMLRTAGEIERAAWDLAHAQARSRLARASGHLRAVPDLESDERPAPPTVS